MLNFTPRTEPNRSSCWNLHEDKALSFARNIDNVDWDVIWGVSQGKYEQCPCPFMQDKPLFGRWCPCGNIPVEKMPSSSSRQLGNWQRRQYVLHLPPNNDVSGFYSVYLANGVSRWWRCSTVIKIWALEDTLCIERHLSEGGEPSPFSRWRLLGFRNVDRHGTAAIGHMDSFYTCATTILPRLETTPGFKVPMGQQSIV